MESTITALLAEIVPAVTLSRTVSSEDAISVPPITRVAPLKCTSLQGLSEEPKSKVFAVVGIKCAEILFGSKPPPRMDLSRKSCLICCSSILILT